MIGDPSVVDEGVGRTPACLESLRGGAHLLVGGDVTDLGQHLGAGHFASQLRGRRLNACLLEIDERHSRAGSGRGPGNGIADASGSACDHELAPLQPETVAVVTHDSSLSLFVVPLRLLDLITTEDVRLASRATPGVMVRGHVAHFVARRSAQLERRHDCASSPAPRTTRSHATRSRSSASAWADSPGSR